MRKNAKPLDRITLESRLTKTRPIELDCIAHTKEINDLEKDSSGRSIFLGTLVREYPIESHEKLKKLSLRIDFRPLFDSIERIDAFIIVKLFRKGSCIERKAYKKVLCKKINANVNSCMELALTDRRTFGKRNLEASDVLEVTLTNKTKQNSKIYFGNMYIKKECKDG